MADIRMSLQQASEATGIPANTLRSRYKVGKLKGERDNSGRLFVWVDPLAPPKKRNSKNAKPVQEDGELEALRGHVETLKDQLAAADLRAATWQAKAEAAATAEIRAATWQAKAEAAQAEVLALWQRIAEEQHPRSWWDRVRGR